MASTGIKISLDTVELKRIVVEIERLARTEKDTATGGMVAVVYKDGRLFFRSQSNLAILQLSMEVEKGPEESIRVAVEGPKLLAATRQLAKAKGVQEIRFLKTGIKFGKIKVATFEPTMFGRFPEGVTKAEKVLDGISNPIPNIERAEHCFASSSAGPLTARCVTVLPRQLLAAWVDQIIMVDCDLLPQDKRAFVAGKELVRLGTLGEFITVRLSDKWLVMSSPGNTLALKQQKEPKFVSQVLEMFQNITFVDSVELDKKELHSELSTAVQVLGKEALITCRLEDGKAYWFGEEEGNEVAFDLEATSTLQKNYSFGVTGSRLLNAVSNSSFKKIIIKIQENLGIEGSPMLHLVDQESHEVISLDPVNALRELDS